MDPISINEGTEAHILAEIDAAKNKKCKRMSLGLLVLVVGVLAVIGVIVAFTGVYQEDIGSNHPFTGIQPAASTSEGQTVTFGDDFFSDFSTGGGVLVWDGGEMNTNNSSSSPSVEEEQQNTISMKFFEDGEELSFIRDAVPIGAAEQSLVGVSSTWFGHESGLVDGQVSTGAATIIKSENGYVSGTVISGKSNKVYMVWTNPDRKQYVRIMDQSSFKDHPDDGVHGGSEGDMILNNDEDEEGDEVNDGEEEEDPFLVGAEDSSTRLLRSTTGRSTAATCSDNGDFLDVLVAYTREAACTAAEKKYLCNPKKKNQAETIKSLIDLAIVETNEAYALSGVKTRLRLVGTMMTEYEYDETDQTDMLKKFKKSTESAFTKVRNKRVELGADLVHVLVANGDYCGTGFVNSKKDSAFSISNYACATGYYSFGHEIGHNQGCTHNKENSRWNGYNDPESRFRTILAYDCKKKSCPRVNRFSHPSIQKSEYNGERVGNQGSAMCAKKINQRRKAMARFMKCKPM